MNQNKPLYNPNYRSDIDGLRALALLSVVILPYCTWAWLCRSLYFFVISGYLISLIIFKSLPKNSFSI